MKVLVKLLVGDRRNLGIIALALVLDLALLAAGRPGLAGLALPLVLLGGIGWAAGR